MSRSRHRRPARKPGRGFEPRPSITLRVERLASGGDGVARDEDGKTVFVKGGVPGELARVRLERERASWARGRVEEVIEPSSLRVEPRCRHFGTCGGCSWQHLAYSLQVEAKATILRDALERIGGFSLDGVPPLMASPDPFGYRSRARLLLRGGRPGYREGGSHRHCAVEECPVLSPELEALVKKRAEHPGAFAGDGTRAPDANREIEWAMCVGRGGAVSQAELPQSGAEVATAKGGGEPGHDAPARVVEFEIEGDLIATDALAFSQANGLLHEALVDRAMAALVSGMDRETCRSWSVLEIHAGVGFFTVPLGHRVAKIVAVEADAHALSLLRENLGRLPEGRAEVEVVGDFFGKLSADRIEGPFDAVLLDPPRSGMTEAEIERLIALAPSRIVYLSCEPATLARDARVLAEAGWQLTHVEGFDLFPQTPHTEGLITLDRPTNR